MLIKLYEGHDCFCVRRAGAFRLINGRKYVYVGRTRSRTGGSFSQEARSAIKGNSPQKVGQRRLTHTATIKVGRRSTRIVWTIWDKYPDRWHMATLRYIGADVVNRHLDRQRASVRRPAVTASA